MKSVLTYGRWSLVCALLSLLPCESTRADCTEDPGCGGHAAVSDTMIYGTINQAPEFARDGITSNCCSANGGTGCDDASCSSAVCAADPSCCSATYDAACAALARQLRLECNGRRSSIFDMGMATGDPAWFVTIKLETGAGIDVDSTMTDQNGDFNGSNDKVTGQDVALNGVEQGALVNRPLRRPNQKCLHRRT